MSAELALIADGGDRESCFTRRELDTCAAAIGEVVEQAAPRDGQTALLLEIGNDAPSLHLLLTALRRPAPLALLDRRAPEAEREAVKDELLRRGLGLVRLTADTGGWRLMESIEAHHRGRVLPDEALVLRSGGTTSRPHLIIDPVMRGIARRPRPTRPSSRLRWRPGQRQLVVGPLHHAATLTFVLEGLADQNTLVLQRLFSPSRTFELIAAHRIDWLHATPHHLQRLADSSDASSADLSSVGAIAHSAAPCPDRVKRWWLDRLGPTRVHELYGASEAVGLTIARGDEWLRRPGTVGRGFFTQIRILRDGAAVAPGVIGDVYMRSGSSAMRRRTQTWDEVPSTPDGFVSVGDRGCVDADDFLYLAPRSIGHILVGGETVFPAEVESALLEHAAVLDAAVGGMPDGRWGERVVALVVPRDGGEVRAADLRAFLRRRLSRPKVPRSIRFVDDLPRAETGKLDRERLRQQLARLTRPSVR